MFIPLECHQFQVTYHLSFFFGSSMPEFLRIARSTLLLEDFLPVAKNLLDRISQGDSKHMLLKQIKKAFNRQPEVSQEYIMDSDIVSRITAT